MLHPSWVLLPLLAGAASPVPPATAEAPKVAVVRRLAPLVVGLAGYGSEDLARQDAQRLNRFLSEHLGWSVLTPVLPSYDALAAALASGKVDVGWIQPVALVNASKKGAVVPLAKAVRRGVPFYRSVLFVRADRKGEGLASLKGARAGWVGPASSSGYLFARAAIVQADFAPAKLFAKEEMLGDHFAVCNAVLDGKVDVGATFADERPRGEAMQVDGCVQAVGAEAASRLRIIATSAPIPNDVIAARPGLSEPEADRIRQAFLTLADSAEGRELLQAVFKADGFAELGEGDFEPVRFATEAAAKKQ